jgi:hypothetical protein
VVKRSYSYENFISTEQVPFPAGRRTRGHRSIIDRKMRSVHRCHTMTNPTSPRSPMGTLSPVRLANAANNTVSAGKSRSINFQPFGNGKVFFPHTNPAKKGSMARLRAESRLDNGETRPPTPIAKSPGLLRNSEAESSGNHALAVSSPQDDALVKRKRTFVRGSRPPPLNIGDDLSRSCTISVDGRHETYSTATAFMATLNNSSALACNHEPGAMLSGFPFSPTHPDCLVGGAENITEKRFIW